MTHITAQTLEKHILYPLLLSSTVAVKHLLTFIHSTGRFKEYVQSDDRPMTNAHCDAELIAKARAISLL
jgi:hypothetical protein